MEIEIGTENLHFPVPSIKDRPPAIQVVRDAVQELTESNTDFEFAPKDVKKIISKKNPDFKLAQVNYLIRVDTVNQSKFAKIPVAERHYWCVEKGIYRLYDPEKDKIEINGETNHD